MTQANLLFFLWGGGVILTTPCVFFLTKEKMFIRILASCLIGATWPLSFIPALLFSLL
ncbi:GhoT/OrtT family toxin [Salmonella enterica subsp. enterica]|nr:GhoT/OrtT family toxin [Salmonella enterica subsp. enterica]